MNSATFPVDDLPYELLVKVFARLPLMDLVRFGKVSSRWHRIQQIALQQVNQLTVLIDVKPEWLLKRRNIKLELVDYINLDDDRYEQVRGLASGLPRLDEMSSLWFASMDEVKMAWITCSMPNVRKLMIVQRYQENVNETNFNQATTVLDHWPNSLTSLTMQNHANVIELICDKFTSLNYLQFEVHETSLEKLFRTLVKLPQLYYLQLNFSSKFRNFNVEANYPTITSVQSPQLTSIQVLYLKNWFPLTHQGFGDKCNWAWAFPSLRAVFVYENMYHKCSLCGITFPKVSFGESTNRPISLHCIQKLLSPFSSCHLLQKAIYDCDEFSEELSPNQLWRP